MSAAAHIARRAERPVPGRRASVEASLAARLLDRDAAPSPRASREPRVRLPERVVRRMVRAVALGRPAPLLFRITRRKLVIEPSGPRRGRAR